MLMMLSLSMMLAITGVVRHCRTPVLAICCRFSFQMGSQAGRNASVAIESSYVDQRSAYFLALHLLAEPSAIMQVAYKGLPVSPHGKDTLLLSFVVGATSPRWSSSSPRILPTTSGSLCKAQMSISF